MHGIHTIDTGFGRPSFDAAYLVVERGRGAFIDSGTRHSLPRFLDAIAAADLEPRDIDWVILTHVHLDHAGGAGELMRHLPNAMLGHGNPEAPTDPALGLSPRQLDVLRLLVEGKPNKLICRELDLSESTVKTHLAAIFRKLNATSRTQAVVAAARLGLRLSGPAGN